MSEATLEVEKVDVDASTEIAEIVELRPLELVFNESLAFEDWARFGGELVKVDENIRWWLGDWWRHGEKRFGEQAAAALPTGFSVQTLRDAARVATVFPPPSENAARTALCRRSDLSFEHHRRVASLPPEQAAAVLAEAAPVEGGDVPQMSTREVAERVKEIQAQARLKKAAIESLPKAKSDVAQFPVVVVDPAWQYDDRRNPTGHETVTPEELKEMVLPITADAIVCLWSPIDRLDFAIDVLAHWGAQYCDAIVWIRDKPVNGEFVASRTEILLMGFTNDGLPQPKTKPIGMVISKAGKHGAKPQQVYDLLGEMFPGVPKAEILGKSEHEGFEQR